MFLFIMIGTYAADSPALFIILDMTPPTIGIVFSSVILRVSKGISIGDNTSSLELAALNSIRSRHIGDRAATEPGANPSHAKDRSIDKCSFKSGTAEV